MKQNTPPITPWIRLQNWENAATNKQAVNSVRHLYQRVPLQCHSSQPLSGHRKMCLSTQPMSSPTPISETPLRPWKCRWRHRDRDFLINSQIVIAPSHPTPDVCTLLGWCGIWRHFSRAEDWSLFQHHCIPYICTVKGQEIMKPPPFYFWQTT